MAKWLPCPSLLSWIASGPLRATTNAICHKALQVTSAWKAVFHRAFGFWAEGRQLL